MKKQNLKLILGISIIITIIGFILDSDEPVGFYLTLFEFTMMTLIISGILAAITITIQFVKSRFTMIRKKT